MSPDVLRGNLAVLVSTLLWASAFPVTQRLLESWDPLPLAAARLGLASAVMLVMAVMTRQLPRLATLAREVIAELASRHPRPDVA